MKPEQCPKLDDCPKIKMILDEQVRQILPPKPPKPAPEKLKTRVFRLWDEKYQGAGKMIWLAHATGISLAHLYRIRRGDRKINATFIVGVAKAFPGYKLDDLFYVGEEANSQGQPTPQKTGLDSKVMLTTTDVAELLELHPNTVRRLNAKGILKSYRVSSRGDRRFKREDIDSFLKEGEID